jgi:hypothetical protein
MCYWLCSTKGEFYVQRQHVLEYVPSKYFFMGKFSRKAFQGTIFADLMFCRPYVIIYHYSEPNVMQFVFSSLRIKGLHTFRALLAHPQEVLHKRYLVYCLRVVSVGCTRIGLEIVSSTPVLVQPTDKTRTQCTMCRLCST